MKNTGLQMFASRLFVPAAKQICIMPQYENLQKCNPHILRQHFLGRHSAELTTLYTKSGGIDQFAQSAL